MNGTYAQNKWLVFNSDQGIFPGGQPLWAPVDENAECPVPEFQLPIGQIAFLDTATNLTIDKATIDANGVPNNVAILIGHGDSARYGFAGKLGYDTCKFKELTASGPKCGQPEITDFWFDCVECGQTASITISWDNFSVRSSFAFNQKARETFSFVVPCPKCVDCPQDDATCDEFADALMKRLGQGYDDSFGLISKRFSKQAKYTQSFPFSIHRILKNRYKFCASPTPTPCDCCGTIADIESIEIGGITAKFGRLGTPSFQKPNDVQKYYAKVQKAFNSAFDGKAYIYFAQGTGTCCPLSVEINTCLDGAPVITYKEGVLADCQDPKAELTPCGESLECGYEVTDPGVITCEICDPEPKVRNYTCGIRVFIDPAKLQCENCGYPPMTNYQSYNGASVDVEQIKGLGLCEVVKAQKATFPTNTGYQLMYMEFGQEPKGDKGRNYRGYLERRGYFQTPGEGGRLEGGEIKCDKSYCVVNLAGRRERGSATSGRHFENQAFEGVTTLAFAKGETDQLAEDVLEIINCLVANGCCSLSPVTCDFTKTDLDTVADSGEGCTSGVGEDESVVNSNRV